VRWLRDLRTLPPWRQALYWLASIAALAPVIWGHCRPGCAVHEHRRACLGGHCHGRAAGPQRTSRKAL